MEHIGWIGLGLMGSRMLPHLLDAGHPASVNDRVEAAAAPLVARGARWCPDAGTVAAESDVVVTIVAFPADVEAVYLAPGGIVERARPGALLIDMTSSSPSLARRIAEAGAARGLDVVDAPVSGGPAGAETAQLSIMVGGADAAVERARPILERLGATIVHQGGPGAGQAAKVVNQIMVGGSMLAICEAFLFADSQGLDRERILSTLGAGITGSNLLRYMWPRLSTGDLEPGFRVEHLIKDLGLALDAAHDATVALPGTALVKELYHAVRAAGYAGKGTQALITALDRSWGDEDA